MNNTNKILKINKNRIFFSYFVGFLIANLIPERYFTPLMGASYDMIFSTIKIEEYDKYYKITS